MALKADLNIEPDAPIETKIASVETEIENIEAVFCYSGLRSAESWPTLLKWQYTLQRYVRYLHAANGGATSENVDYRKNG